MFTRREFFAAAGAASSAQRLLLPATPQSVAAHQNATPPSGRDVASGFPVSDYTPFGYLDNPYHTWDLNRSGVIRSVPGVGVALYYPAGPGGYFDYAHNGVYEAVLRLGFASGDRRFWSPTDFGPGQLTARHHSKNLLRYEFAESDVDITATFVQVNENALGALVEFRRRGPAHASVKLLAAHTYRLGGASSWGRDGLAGTYDASADCVWIRSFAAGTVFALAGDHSSGAHFVGKGELQHWRDPASNVAQGFTYHPEPLHGGLEYSLELPPDSPSQIAIVLARAPNRDAAVEHARASLASVREDIARKRAEDDTFWSGAPRLEGDWPKHWKHGWVYDFETLRMMVRRPAGVYKHRWDAMQIQAPRNVLAETSIDMWALSYADPETAKAVFLGQFLDALEDNIPCMREDGVMNMVAVDGSECGTSISWCFPYFCAASIFDRTRDVLWVRAVYPRMARLLRWTLANRRDAGGFLIGKCSWETGMDASKRFLIQQPTGGELTEFVRLVELQAAAAQAGAILARFARLAGDAASVREWEEVTRTYTAKTQELWSGDWFHDFDTRSNQLATSAGRDPAQAAPAFCGLANEEQKRRMVPTLRKFFDDSKALGRQPASGWDDGLAWSSLMLPYVESIWSTGEGELAAQVVATIADRIYTSMDRRSVEAEMPESRPRLGWPGVSCEIWGAHGAFGGEGYGWGAVMPAHIIRSIAGFRETEDPDKVWLCPNLITEMMKPGTRYAIQALRHGDDTLDLALHVVDPQRVRVEGRWRGHTRTTSVAGANSKPVELSASGINWHFEAQNHSRHLLTLSGGPSK
jgi:hypothetical protein